MKVGAGLFETNYHSDRSGNKSVSYAQELKLAGLMYFAR